MRATGLQSRVPIAAALGLTAGGRARAARTIGLDLTGTVDVYRAYTRMRGAGDGQLALWSYAGTVWLKVEEQVPRQVMTVDGFSFQRLSTKPDGSLVQWMAEAGYFKDADGKQILETWVNPFDGETCRVPHYKSMQKIIARPDTSRSGEEGGRMDGNAIKGRIGPATVNGDRVWIPENFGTTFRIPRRDNADPKEDVGVRLDRDHPGWLRNPGI